MGKRDAKVTRGIKDYSRTHSILRFESLAVRGETLLNEWLVKVSSPYIAGNARIEAEAQLLCDKIARQKTMMGTTGRQRKSAAQRLAGMQQEMSDLKSQFAANREIGYNLIRRAEEIKGLWGNLYVEKVAIYNAFRFAKVANSADASSVDAPSYRSIELALLEQFDREFPINKEC